MIGNILALTNSTSNENIEVDGLLKKGLYNGNASDLKSEIDKKVSQEAGKGLSSNDYTNEEKQKNEENALKRVANITVTGDVNKIITITFADSTVMQAPFKDNNDIPLADVNMNSLNFNENTGVLTGIKSDGNEISVSLDGRYSLIGHNHDEQYSPKTHTHSEYAYRTHRHNKDDIDGLPTNIATTENVKTAIDRIQIGGRNYIVGSNVVINSAYNQTMRMSNELIAILNSVRLVTVSVYIEYSKLIALGNRRLGYEFVITYTDNSKHYVHAWKPVSEADLGGSYAGRFSLTHALHNGKTIQSITSTGLHIQCTAENVKLGLPKVEIGNKPTDWSPAPEDLDFHKGNITLSDLNSFKFRETGGYSVDVGGGWGAYLNYKLQGSTSSIEFYKRNWYPATRLGVRNSVDGNRFNDDNGAFRDLAWHSDVYRPGIAISTNYTVPPEQQNNTLIIGAGVTIELNQLQNLSSVSFMKVTNAPNVNLICTGKTVKWIGDNNFSGKEGSTATATIYSNNCFIRTSNV